MRQIPGPVVGASAETAPGLFFRGDDFAAVIMTAGRTDVMRPFQLTAIGAFSMGFGGERVMRPAHIAFRRRSFSFWNRHGQTFLIKSGRTGAQKSRRVNQNSRLPQGPETLFRVP